MVSASRSACLPKKGAAVDAISISVGAPRLRTVAEAITIDVTFSMLSRTTIFESPSFYITK
jgi:hypothetical protein